jgi:hypothetical protein
MKLIIYLLIISSISSLTSCGFSNCEEIALSKDERKTFKSYFIGQHIIYKSNLNNLDTFLVTNLNNYYTTCSKFELGDRVYNYLTVTMQKVKNGKVNKKVFWGQAVKFEKRSKNKPCNKHFQVFGLVGDGREGDTLIEKWITNTHSLKNQLCWYFEFNLNTSDLYGGIVPVNCYYWNKSDGLVRYIATSGEVFDLYYKSKANRNKL